MELCELLLQFIDLSAMMTECMRMLSCLESKGYHALVGWLRISGRKISIGARFFFLSEIRETGASGQLVLHTVWYAACSDSAGSQCEMSAPCSPLQE